MSYKAVIFRRQPHSQTSRSNILPNYGCIHTDYCFLRGILSLGINVQDETLEILNLILSSKEY